MVSDISSGSRHLAGVRVTTIGGNARKAVVCGASLPHPVELAAVRRRTDLRRIGNAVRAGSGQSSEQIDPWDRDERPAALDRRTAKSSRTNKDRGSSGCLLTDPVHGPFHFTSGSEELAPPCSGPPSGIHWLAHSP